MIKTVLAACALLCALTIAADARPRQRTGLHPECNVTMPCVAPSASTPEQVRVARGRYIARQLGIGGAIERRAVRAPKARPALSYGAPSPSIAYTAEKVAAQVIGGRPAGCPYRFCGCGASLHLFGKIIPSLNLAANWLRFPRAEPAPRMAAARRGHVFVLERHIAGNVWLVHDSNSGRGKTRLHARSIAGYVVVNPHGAG